MDKSGPHLSATEARAGRSAHVVRYVLAISLTAIVVVFAIMLMLNR